MYGPDVFAVFTAHDHKNKAGSAFELKHNTRWFRKAIGGAIVAPTINSREITLAEDSQSDNNDYNVKKEDSAVDRLIVIFDQLFTLNNFHNGLQLGTNPCVSHVFLCERLSRSVRNQLKKSK